MTRFCASLVIVTGGMTLWSCAARNYTYYLVEPEAAEHPDTARTSAILRELGISSDQFQGPTSKDLKILLSATGKSGLLPLLFPQDMGHPL